MGNLNSPDRQVLSVTADAIPGPDHDTKVADARALHYRLHPHEPPTQSSTAARLPDHLTDFYKALHRRKEGVIQAAHDVVNLSGAPNDVFVERIQEDCHIGPHWEWIPTASIALAKGAAKLWLLAKATEHGGTAAKVAGGTFGLTWGLTAGLYTGYHLTEYKENSCIADNLEKRLDQFKPGGLLSTPPLDTTTLPLPQIDSVEHNLPGVRDLVHGVQDGAQKLWYEDLQHKAVPDREFEIAKKVEAKDLLGKDDFAKWARQESASSPLAKYGKETAYAGIGYLTSAAAINKVYAGSGPWQFKVAGAVAGLALAWAGNRESEHERLVELASARVISKPEDFKDNTEFIKWAKQQAAADPYYKYGKEGTFAGIGVLAGAYTVSKLGIGESAFEFTITKMPIRTPYSLIIKGAAAGIGVALGWLGSASHESKALADLYTARLESMPDEHP
jgi:hypothetical protein